MMDRSAILERLREAYGMAAKAVEDGHAEGRVELIEAGEMVAREIVDVLKLIDKVERLERRRWKAPSVRNAGIMLNRR